MRLPLIRNVDLMILLIIFLFLLIYGCQGEDYAGEFFSYPPNTTTDSINLEYLGRFIITQKEKIPLTRKAHKNVVISIQKNADKKYYLSDKLQFYSAYIDAVIEWKQFDKLDIILYEAGNEFADDDYNRQLIIKGPNQLIHLKYTYDVKANKFIRKE